MIHTRSNYEKRARKLADERKFDDLLEHLRTDDPGRDACARDEQLLGVCVGAGIPALDVIDILVERGADTRPVFQQAACYANVEFLEAACARNWHGEHTHRDIFRNAARGAGESDALNVFRWLSMGAREKYFGGNMLQDSLPDGERRYREDLLLDVFLDKLVGGCFDAVDYLMHHAVELGFGLAVAARMRYGEDGSNGFLDDLIQHVLYENARTECLDFLCTRFDKDHVVETISSYLEENNDPDRRDHYWTDWYWDDVVRWYLLRSELEETGRQLYAMAGSISQPGKEYLKNAMKTLDTVKERLPEGEYLKLCSDMQKAYETM